MNIIENFKNYRLDIKGQSLGTVKGYLSDLNLFFKYMNMDLINLFIDNQWSKLSKEDKMKKLGLKYEQEE